MKAHGVQSPSLHCDLELKISYQNLFEQGGVSLVCKLASWMKQGSMTLLRSSVDAGVGWSLLWAVRSRLWRVAWSWSVGVVRDVGGEISSEFAPCAFKRSPPH